MISLQALSLSANQIDSVPKSIGRMKSLTVLELSANNISFVPAEVFNSTLENINLSTNYISLNFKTVSKCKAKINLTNNYIPSTFNFKKIFPKATILLDPKDYETNKISVEEH